MQGITSIGDALEAQANAKAGTRRRLLQREEAVQGLTLSVALLGETKGTFAPKQVLHGNPPILQALECSNQQQCFETCCIAHCCCDAAPARADYLCLAVPLLAEEL